MAQENFQNVFNLGHPIAARVGVLPRNLKKYLKACGYYADKDTVTEIKDKNRT